MNELRILVMCVGFQASGGAALRPPEGDYGDETERETMTDLMYRQGKMGYVSGVHGELVGMQGATLVVGDDHFGGAPNCPNKSIGGLLIQDSNQKHSDACT